MKKATIELARFEKSTKGYGWLNPPKPISNKAQLDALCKWSKDPPSTNLFPTLIGHTTSISGIKNYEPFKPHSRKKTVLNGIHHVMKTFPEKSTEENEITRIKQEQKKQKKLLRKTEEEAEEDSSYDTPSEIFHD